MSEVTSAAVFLDFDGTISRADVVDAMLERFAAREWLRVEEDWRAGRIGSRECLRRQMDLVRAEPAAMDAAIDAVGIDPGLADVLQVCAAAQAPALVVSDGFDYCIRRLLRAAPAAVQPMVQAMTVCASHLEPAEGGRWRTDFRFPETPCEHGCATCKPALMRERAPAGSAVVFVGDGLSDRHAAAVADVLFAKDRLAEYCVAQRVAFVPFTNLAEVAMGLSERLRAGLPLRRRASASIGA